MSWNDRDKDSESNVNSLFKRHFPRYRSRGIFNSLLEEYLTNGDEWRKKLLPVILLDAPARSHCLKSLIMRTVRWMRCTVYLSLRLSNNEVWACPGNTATPLIRSIFFGPLVTSTVTATVRYTRRGASHLTLRTVYVVKDGGSWWLHLKPILCLATHER